MNAPSLVQNALLVLDVDGTVSRTYREEEYEEHQDDPSWRSWMTVDDDVVDAIDEFVKRLEVQIAVHNADDDLAASARFLEGRVWQVPERGAILTMKLKHPLVLRISGIRLWIPLVRPHLRHVAQRRGN